MKKALLIGTAALALSALPALAQTQRPAPTPAPNPAQSPAPKPAPSAKAPADQAFVTEAAKGGMAEVELGKLAAEKATNDDVKKFGQRMADDHSKANDELKSIASKKNITLPTDIDAKDKALRDRLMKLSGAAFDRAYMRAMVSDHVKDVSAFKRESQAGKDADVKAFAAKTLPTLEDHLTLARTTDRQVVGTSGSKNSTPKPAAAKP
jgi:putative membrane protein